ncbi:MAG: hypothetical protein LQ342_003642 [Letrouitia transgressa]|nr:MAG: hypothetical protein LQ342_003642 [Letrouitia transgressa]
MSDLSPASFFELPAALPVTDSLALPSTQATFSPRSSGKERVSDRKRGFEDEALGIDDFSDTPIFSSDDPQQDSLENYSRPATHRDKRQRSGPWWDSSHQPQDLDFTVISPPGGNKKREFRRNMDSGVWMAEQDDDNNSVVSNPKLGNLKTVTSDSGWLGGPIFPFWDEQPQDVQMFWEIQAEAVERVNKCVDNGNALVDLSNLGLSKLQEPTLRPLCYHVCPFTQGTFYRDIRIFLANNALLTLPGTLFSISWLTVLSLRSNELTFLPPAISRLEHLYELNLSNNNFRFLPFELRSLVCKDRLRVLSLFPNPFLRPLPKTSVERRQPSCPVYATRVAYFDIHGNPNYGCLTLPSKVSCYWPATTPTTRLTIPQDQDCTPSLLELSLRACSTSPQIAQLPFLLPPKAPGFLRQHLENAYWLTTQGGQACTVCGKPFIVPRTEWIEWWVLEPKKYGWLENGFPQRQRLAPTKPLVPLLRRGCSWACVPEDSEKEPEGFYVGWGPAKGTDAGRFR